jgi:hypothetical protein
MAPPTVLPPTRRRTGISGPAASRATSEAARRGPAKRTRRPPRSTQSISADSSSGESVAISARIKGVGTGQQHVRKRAFHQVRRGRERLPKVMQRRQERLPLVVPLGVDQRDLAPLQRVIGKRHRTGRPDTRDLEPGDAVAQFRRQVEDGGARVSPVSSATVCRARSRGMPAGSRPWATMVSSRGAGAIWRRTST